MGKYLQQIKKEDIIDFISKNLREDFNLEKDYTPECKIVFSPNKIQVKTYDWNSGNAMFLISDFFCIRNSQLTPSHREKDLSFEWANFMRKKVPKPTQYCDEYNNIIDENIKRLEQEYLFKRLSLTSMKIPSLSYIPQNDDNDKTMN